jgi:hypothetical protein
MAFSNIHSSLQNNATFKSWCYTYTCQIQAYLNNSSAPTHHHISVQLSHIFLYKFPKYYTPIDDKISNNPTTQQMQPVCQ